MKLDRIRVVPGVCDGRPTIRGLRITVEFVLKLLADGYSADDIVREYSDLNISPSTVVFLRTLGDDVN